jgi:enamine deaminase RidA (YjgF/YER057c/UK114 family)
MTSNETAAAVRALLESYRDAFERLGAAAIAVTTLVVAALARPELLIEIDVTAASAN